MILIFRNEILFLLGPSHWGEEYQTCLGKHQSPINIEEHNVKNVSLPPLILIGIDNPCQSYVTNTGHTGENFTVRFYLHSARRESDIGFVTPLARDFLALSEIPLGNSSQSRSWELKLRKTLPLRYNRNDKTRKQRERNFVPCNYKYPLPLLMYKHSNKSHGCWIEGIKTLANDSYYHYWRLNHTVMILQLIMLIRNPTQM